METTPLAVVILAAGQGKRMANPDLPKVMVELAGKPMLGRVLSVVSELSPARTILIVGHHRELVINYTVANFGTDIEFAVQQEQLGTGHAVMQTEKLLKNFEGNVLILSGDVPLLTVETIQKLIAYHEAENNDLSMLTVNIADPTHYGRIIRDESGKLQGIVEDRDATPEQKSITEINPAIYIVRNVRLFEALNHIAAHNAQGEYYLTDIVGVMNTAGNKIGALTADDYKETVGVNTPEELTEAEEILRG